MLYEYILNSDLDPNEVYNLHQKVMDHYTAGGDAIVESGGNKRPIWRSMPNENGCMLLVRSLAKPLSETPSISSRELQHTLNDEVRFNVRQSLSERKPVFDDNNVQIKTTEKIVHRDNVHQWLSDLLFKHGLELENCSLISECKIPMKKKKYYIIAADFVFNAKIVDLEKFEHAYKYGIGRQKAFGFGLLLGGK